MRLKLSKKIVIGIAIVLAVTSGVGFLNYILRIKVKTSKAALYRCPMHPAYTSDRPGDCPICGMKLVKAEDKAKISQDVATRTKLPVVAGKDISEICVDHKCAMKNCPMMVKTHIKPGEKISCPVCGEVIGVENGKVVEILPENGKTAMEDDMDSENNAHRIMLSEQRQQMIGVESEPVEFRKLSKLIHASGKVAYDPELANAQEEFLQAFLTLDKVKNSSQQDTVDRARELLNASRNRLRFLGMNSLVVKTAASCSST